MVVFLITSPSNASLDQYPDNTLTKFRHHFPKRISLKPGLSHTIYLKSISVDAAVAKAAKGGIIKVHLLQLDTQTSPKKGDAQVLARIPSSLHTQDGSPLWHEFNHPIHCVLEDSDELHELDFLLTDINNKQLSVEGFGVATVINIVLKEMDYQDQFSITVNPRYSSHIYTSNTCIDFRIHFPSTIELGPNWEVALHHVIVPRSMYIESTAHMKVNKKSYQWNIFGTSGEEVFRAVTGGLSAYNFSLEIEYTGDEELLVLKNSDSRRKKGTVYLNSYLCQALGIIGHEGIGKLWRLSYGETVVVRKAKEIVFQSVRCDHIAIYSDIVQESIVGNSSAKLLEIVSTSQIGIFNTSSDTIYHLPHLTFRPISKYSFDSLQFYVAGMDGKEPSIHDSGEGITYTLLFRQKQNEK